MAELAKMSPLATLRQLYEQHMLSVLGTKVDGRKSGNAGNFEVLMATGKQIGYSLLGGDWANQALLSNGAAAAIASVALHNPDKERPLVAILEIDKAQSDYPLEKALAKIEQHVMRHNPRALLAGVLLTHFNESRSSAEIFFELGKVELNSNFSVLQADVAYDIACPSDSGNNVVNSVISLAYTAGNKQKQGDASTLPVLDAFGSDTSIPIVPSDEALTGPTDPAVGSDPAPFAGPLGEAGQTITAESQPASEKPQGPTQTQDPNILPYLRAMASTNNRLTVTPYRSMPLYQDIPTILLNALLFGSGMLDDKTTELLSRNLPGFSADSIKAAAITASISAKGEDAQLLGCAMRLVGAGDREATIMDCLAIAHRLWDTAEGDHLFDDFVVINANGASMFECKLLVNTFSNAPSPQADQATREYVDQQASANPLDAAKPVPPTVLNAMAATEPGTPVTAGALAANVKPSFSDSLPLPVADVPDVDLVQLIADWQKTTLFSTGAFFIKVKDMKGHCYFENGVMTEGPSLPTTATIVYVHPDRRYVMVYESDEFEPGEIALLTGDADAILQQMLEWFDSSLVSSLPESWATIAKLMSLGDNVELAQQVARKVIGGKQ